MKLNFNDFEKDLEKLIIKNTPHHDILEGYLWATIPAGKLFRPNLLFHLASDLNANLSIYKNDLTLLAAALEVHHAYSLVHDDLPSMDNDDFRRGKLSVHKKYGEWKAILIGDGLLNLSYRFLSQLNIKSERLQLLLKVFSWSMGSKGLIHGQNLDLSHEMNKNFETLLLTHKLKTGRLIQCSLLFAHLLVDDKINFFKLKKTWRFGENLGIVFQLLDDLSELAEENLSTHEKDVNPWPKNLAITEIETLKRLSRLEDYLKTEKLTQTQSYIAQYLNGMNNIFKDKQKNIENHINENKFSLDPVIFLIDRICQV